MRYTPLGWVRNDPRRARHSTPRRDSLRRAVGRGAVGDGDRDPPHPTRRGEASRLSLLAHGTPHDTVAQADRKGNYIVNYLGG